ncbi:hypothetical protein V9T40_004666 [Parthenolecanium corni]|uniref:Uncharacterized protein n=1 Tax=Parthenolecanium corni TaxID=536013 RepID=A0AAN9TGL6_9HEMI
MSSLRKISALYQFYQNHVHKLGLPLAENQKCLRTFRCKTRKVVAGGKLASRLPSADEVMLNDNDERSPGPESGTGCTVVSLLSERPRVASFDHDRTPFCEYVADPTPLRPHTSSHFEKRDTERGNKDVTRDE